MLILRLQKVGRKKDYTYRVVAVDSHFSAKSGKVKEILGWWDPKKDKFSLDQERIKYWLNQGAQVSDSCYNLLVKGKVIEGKKRPIKIKKKKKEEEQSIQEESTQGQSTESTEVESTEEGATVSENIS
ncbi:MAG: 30S ribosomal protein S16 [Candidatus Paceibacterota bacterium]